MVELNCSQNDWNVVTSPLNRSNMSFGNFGLITVGCCGSGCAAEAWPTFDPLSPMSPCDGSLIVSFSVNLAKISTVLAFASSASSTSLSIASKAQKSRIFSSYTCNASCFCSKIDTRHSNGFCRHL